MLTTVLLASQAPGPPGQALETLVTAAADQLPGIDHAGVTLLRQGRPETVAASSPVPRLLDELQAETGEGPVLTALVDSACVAHLGTGGRRWPAFAARAAEVSAVQAAVSVRLSAGEAAVGALTLYAERPDAVDDGLVLVGELLAASASTALQRAQAQERIGHLERALESSREIGAAVGILMSRYRVTETHAFDLLRHASQRSNRKLRDVAGDVLHTGDLPSRTGG